MKDLDVITGKVNEEELDNLVNEDIVNGGSWWVGLITAVIVATYAAGACPTSACTVKCNK